MDKSRLVEFLERLHAELEQTQGLDDESCRLLQHLEGDIQAVLQKPSAASRASLRSRLEAAITHFEESHSRLTIAIQEVLDHLANV